MTSRDDPSTVNGIKMGETLKRDRFGRDLPVLQGCRFVGDGEIFLMNSEVSDSLEGRYFGPTRIIGQYDDAVTFGQRRVLWTWSRLNLPGGRSIDMERLPGAEASGFASVDYHRWDLETAAGLSTLLAVGTELAMSDENRLIRAIREGA